MGKVVKCFQEFPEIQKQIEQIIDNVADTTLWRKRSPTEIKGKDTLGEPASKKAKEEDLATTLKTAIQNAQESDNPIEVIQDSISALEQFYALKATYHPFLRDVSRLMNRLQGQPAQVKTYVLPLLQKVFVDSLLKEGWTPLEGDRFAAHLLYIADKNLWGPLSGTFATAHEEMKSCVEKDLVKIFGEGWDMIKGWSQIEKFYEFESFALTHFPQIVAQILVSSDGTVNIGLLDILKKSLLPHELKNKPNMDKERYIIKQLKELQRNEVLLTLLESIPVPQGDEWRTTINSMLGRALDHQISEQDTRVILLMSFLTKWTQDKVGTCFISSAGIQRKELLSEWLLEDFAELFAYDSAVERTIEGRPYKFYGLHWPIQKALLNTKHGYSSNKIVYSASKELGCKNREDYEEAVTQVEKSGKEPTLYAIFEELQAMHGKPPEALERACKIIEGRGQNLLLRVWENTFGSTIFLPIVGNSVPIGIWYSHGYFKAIADAFSEVAQKAKLAPLTEQLKEFVSLFEADRPLSVVYSREIPRLLQQFRATLIPQVVHSSEKTSWVLGIEKEGKFIPFKNREEFALYLRDTFLEWASLTGLSLDENAKKTLFPWSGLELEELFDKGLRKAKQTEEWGSINGKLCYSMPGGGFLTLEKSTVEFLTSPPRAFSPDPEVACRQFLQWTKDVRDKYGADENLSIAANAQVTKDTFHIFTLLPNHPTITRSQTADVLSEIKQKVITQVCEEVHPLEEIQKKLKDLLFPLTMTRKQEEREAVYADLEQSLKHEIGDRLHCSYLDAAKAVMKTVKKYEKLYEKAEDKACFFACLSSLLGPEYLHQFIHFADTNHRAWVGDDIERLQYMFWFDPRDSKWDIVEVPESDRIELPVLVPFVNPKFWETLVVQPNIEVVSKALQQKAILALEQKAISAFQKVEREFANSWKALEQETAKLKPEDRTLVRDELILPIDEEMSEATLLEFPPFKQAPEEWKNAFAKCQEVRKKYVGLLELSAKRSKDVEEAFRLTHILTSSSSLPNLINSEEEFRYAVRDLLIQ